MRMTVIYTIYIYIHIDVSEGGCMINLKRYDLIKSSNIYAEVRICADD